MARIIRKVGSGITAEKKVTYTEADADAAMDRHIERWNAALALTGNVYGAHTLDDIELCKRILAKAGDGPHEEHSPAWFAGKLLILHELVTKAIARDDPANAARFALEFGRLLTQAEMKESWERDAMRGRKVAGGERNAALKTNARHDKLRQQRFAIIAELGPAIGVDSAAAQCEIEGLGRRDAIKRQWYRFQKKE